MYDLNEVICGNDWYIYNSSVRVSQLFNNKCQSRYLHPCIFLFDKEHELKKDFTHLLKDFDIKPVLTTIKTPQANAPVEQVHKVIINMLVTKYLSHKWFDFIYPWGETLEYISWVIRDSYHRTIQYTPVKAVFFRDMIYLTSLHL